MIKKKKNNIVKFPRNISKIERQVEAILFAASEPLDIETIEKRTQSSANIQKILQNIKSDYDPRGINLVCIKGKWSFRTAEDLSKLMSLQKSTQKNYQGRLLKLYLLLFTTSPLHDQKLKKSEVWLLQQTL